MVQHLEKLENIRKKQIELKNKITEINTHTHTLEWIDSRLDDTV